MYKVVSCSIYVRGFLDVCEFVSLSIMGQNYLYNYWHVCFYFLFLDFCIFNIVVFFLCFIFTKAECLNYPCRYNCLIYVICSLCLYSITGCLFTILYLHLFRICILSSLFAVSILSLFTFSILYLHTQFSIYILNSLFAFSILSCISISIAVSILYLRSQFSIYTLYSLFAFSILICILNSLFAFSILFLNFQFCICNLVLYLHSQFSVCILSSVFAFSFPIDSQFPIFYCKSSFFYLIYIIIHSFCACILYLFIICILYSEFEFSILKSCCIHSSGFFYIVCIFLFLQH